MKMSPNCDIFCKKIVLKSKVIVSNKTKRDFKLKEELASTFQTSLKAEEKKQSIYGLP